MGCSLFSSSHFQMGVTVMGFGEHFGHYFFQKTYVSPLHTCLQFKGIEGFYVPGEFINFSMTVPSFTPSSFPPIALLKNPQKFLKGIKNFSWDLSFHGLEKNFSNDLYVTLYLNERE